MCGPLIKLFTNLYIHIIGTSAAVSLFIFSNIDICYTTPSDVRSIPPPIIDHFSNLNDTVERSKKWFS